jgi:hypothetical protein
MHLLDANVFIAAKNGYYGIDFAPGFWDWLAQEHPRSGLRSIAAVRDELLAQDDDLAAWVRGMPAGFWLEESDAEVLSLRAVAAWSMGSELRFTQQARTDFLAAADYRLVAQALAGRHTVVTHEVSQPEAQKRIKLPDACEAFGVVHRRPFELFRQLGLRLVRPEATDLAA